MKEDKRANVSTTLTKGKKGLVGCLLIHFSLCLSMDPITTFSVCLCLSVCLSVSVSVSLPSFFVISPPLSLSPPLPPSHSPSFCPPFTFPPKHHTTLPPFFPLFLLTLLPATFSSSLPFTPSHSQPSSPSFRSSCPCALPPCLPFAHPHSCLPFLPPFSPLSSTSLPLNLTPSHNVQLPSYSLPLTHNLNRHPTLPPIRPSLPPLSLHFSPSLPLPSFG